MKYKINDQTYTSVGVMDEEAYAANPELWDYQVVPAPDRHGSHAVRPKNEKHAGTAFIGLTLSQRCVKRAFDIAVALVAFTLFSPLIAVITLAVWLGDFHSPIFSQQRVGRKGKVFTIYKFRTMRIDSESDGVPKLCEKHDARHTKVGAFLRDHHLDEFPQLWNVFKGDMSVVGPRPERPYFTGKILEEYPDYRLLSALRPGLFSEATLYNGYTETMAQMIRRAEMDLDYLKGYSFRRDISIIWKTAYSIISGKEF